MQAETRDGEMSVLLDNKLTDTAKVIVTRSRAKRSEEELRGLDSDELTYNTSTISILIHLFSC